MAFCRLFFFGMRWSAEKPCAEHSSARGDVCGFACKMTASAVKQTRAEHREAWFRILLPLPTKNALLSTDKGAFFELSVPQAEREVCFASEAHFVREVCLRHDMRNT